MDGVADRADDGQRGADPADDSPSAAQQVHEPEHGGDQQDGGGDAEPDPGGEPPGLGGDHREGFGAVVTEVRGDDLGDQQQGRGGDEGNAGESSHRRLLRVGVWCPER